MTGSLALLADAGHMLTDVAGLVLALAAMKLAERRPSPRRTCGYHRVEILAALTNALALLGGGRLHPGRGLAALPEPATRSPAWRCCLVAAVGLLVNVGRRPAAAPGSRSSLNVRGAYNEVLADARRPRRRDRRGAGHASPPAGAGSTRRWRSRSRCSSCLAPSRCCGRRCRCCVEGAPREVDVGALRTAMEDVPGVKRVHDLHVWTLTSGVHALSAHAIRAPERHTPRC